MAKHFEFADFVDEFAVDFVTLEPTPGYHNDAGTWVPGEKIRKAKSGIILPLSNDDFKREANGTYTSQDRKIYVVDPMAMGTVIEYKGETFTVDGSKPYEDYADVYIYFAKGVVK